ncbi:MAG: LPXTG cell wall anchor domain-containing protein [Actinobacteria bacterium]|nr:LPXTG cell wall anchor domain-containing protein [Actinomycetota bacterium]
MPSDDDFFSLFPDSLPSTGMPGFGFGLVGAFLLLLGVAALPAARRRRGPTRD